MRRFITPLAALVLSACASSHCTPPAATTTTTASSPPDASSAPSSPQPLAPAATALAAAPPPAPAPALAPSPHDQFVAWLKSRIPAGDEVVSAGDASPVEVVHTILRGEMPAALAHAYLPLSDVYFEDDFAEEIAKSARKEGGYRPGNKVHVPHLVTAPFKSADEERIPPPEDKAIRGLYIRGGTTALRMFLHILDQMSKRDINAIVLDAKDYDGPVTYDSKIPLVEETGADKGAPIK
ncbi:MAG TPA: hypothetical protein VGI39_44975, partial [Polyangiaceae bacterium]